MKGALLLLTLILPGPSLLAASEIFHNPITLREALGLMRARNPVLASLRAHAQAIQANEITAGLRPNPVFTSANEDFNVFDPGRFDIRGAQEFTDNILQTMERGGKRRYRVESARLTTKVVQDTYRDQERQLEFAVRSAFVNLLLAQSSLQLARDNLRDYQEMVRLNEIRLKAGDISPTEMDRIRLEQAGFENDLLNAQLALSQARIQLEGLLGLEDLPEKFDVQGELAAPELPISLQDFEQRALENRPDFLAARDSVNKAQADVRLAYANGATDISIGGEYKRNDSANTLGFTVALPLKIFDRNQGEKVRTQREVEASQLGELAARLVVLSDVAQAYQAYRVALSKAQLYSKEYLQRARGVRDRTEFSFRHGGAGLLDYLDALRSYRNIELAWRSAYAQVLTAIHQLSLATGTEVLP